MIAMKRIGIWCIAVILAAFLVALAESRFFWGYWMNRPTLAAALNEAEQIEAVSMLQFSDAGVQVVDRESNAELSIRFCRPRTLNECREGSLLLAIDGRWDSRSTPEVSAKLLEQAWSQVRRQGWLPEASDPRYSKSSQPAAGLAIHFRRSDARYVLLAYRTSEVANDRYAYAETLHEIDGSELKLIRQVHFFLEIAGLEGILEWPTLWVVNAAILGTVLLIFSSIRLLRRPRHFGGIRAPA